MSKSKNILPPQLVKAVNESRCVFFFGAGVSFNAGLSSGQKLSNVLFDELIADIQNDEDYKSKVNQINKDNLKRVSQLYDSYYGIPKRAHTRIADILAVEERSAKTEILEPLRYLPTIKEIITTNYDNLIENVLDPTSYQRIYRNEDLRQVTGPKVKVIKLHGTRSDINSMVLTDEDYDKYFDTHESIVELTKTLFRQKILVMVGYSLEDENFGQIFEQTKGLSKGELNFFVSPNTTLYQDLRWEQRGFRHVEHTAESFLKTLKETYAENVYREETATSKGTLVQLSEGKAYDRESLFNPFVLHDTEALVEAKPQLLFDTFVNPVGFPTILDHQHTFIEGHRGSGKSTILWRLSLKSLAYNTSINLPMWGFYIKMVPGWFDAFRRKTNLNEEFIETNEEWFKYFLHYFNLIVLSGILKDLEEAIELNLFEVNENLSQSINRILKSLLRLDDTQGIEDLRTLRFSVEEEIDTVMNERSSLKFYTSATFISRALELLSDAIPKLKEKHWHILLDEYDNIYPQQQAVINVLLRERNSKIRYKIAVKTLFAYLKDIDNKTLDPTDDFGYVSCDSTIWDKDLKPKYFDFIERLSEQRLKYAGHKISIKELLPEAKEKTEYYAGFEAFCYLSSGLTRLYLDLCKNAVYEAYPDTLYNKVELEPIPVTIQNHVARVQSAILFKSYRSTPDPRRVLRLFRVFGPLFRGIAKITEGQKEYRTPLSFELKNLDLLSPDSLDLLENTIKARLLQVPKLPKQPHNPLKDSPSEKYSFHRLLVPFFKLSLTERYAVGVDAEQFNDIWEHPEIVLEKLSMRYKSKGIDEYIEKMLPLFDQDSDI